MENTFSAPPRVAFFDSGIGGLTLLNECVRKLPYVDFIYVADNFNMPYGNKPYEEVLNLVDAHFEKINALNPAAAVIACNTVTAACARFLRSKYSFPIIGIQPAVKPAAKDGGKCVVLATPATAASAPVKELVQRYGNGITEVVPCENLAAYIEGNIFNLDAEQIVSLLPNTHADSVVLGCTHYIYAEKIIARFYGCHVYDGLEGTANHLCEILGNFDHFPKSRGKVTFLGGDTDKNAEVFAQLNPESG